MPRGACLSSSDKAMFAKGSYDKPFLHDNKELLSRLKQCTNLPTPPGVAAKIIELGQDPEVRMASLADAVSLDPALTAKIFRVANSPLYGHKRKTENLRQAVTLFGLNGTLSLALSFSLLRTFSGPNDEGMNYNLFWRRSLAVATCCRAIGSRAVTVSKLSPEDLFLSGLLQDIGMLALDRAVPGLYRNLGSAQLDHARVQAVEQAALGADHAEVGAWLLESWNFPQHLVYAVAGSHDPDTPAIGEEYRSLARCAAVSGNIAEIFWREDYEQTSRDAADMAENLLGMDRETLRDIFASLAAELQQTAALFNLVLGDGKHIEYILDQAKEILMLRNLQSVRHSAELKKQTESLASRTRELEEETQRDSLTGLYNRAFLDQACDQEFKNAKNHNWPLTIVFLDVDHFKRVNDTHGHYAGDEVLRATARLLKVNTRESDFVTRYGGEEFVLLLPGTGREGARIACNRLISAFRNTEHDIGKKTKVTVTMSVGVAVMDKESQFEKPEDLLRAADRALYTAKQEGRNRWVLYGDAST